MNEYYNGSGYPAYSASGDSASARTELLSIQTAFDKLPVMAGHALLLVRVNAAATGLETFTNNFTQYTTVTGSTIIAAGTTAQRDVSPNFGYTHANNELKRLEWWNGSSWVQAGGGASGSGSDAGMYENDAFISTSYTIGSGSLISGVTVTIATPGVFTLNGHGFVQDSQVMLETTGALPTGLLPDTGYFVIAAGLTANAFELSTTQGGSAITTSGSQSGVHSVGKLKNATSAGVVSIATGAIISIPTGATWSIL